MPSDASTVNNIEHTLVLVQALGQVFHNKTLGGGIFGSLGYEDQGVNSACFTAPEKGSSLVKVILWRQCIDHVPPRLQVQKGITWVFNLVSRRAASDAYASILRPSPRAKLV